MHPFIIYNDKSLPMVALGALIWGDIMEFNKKFADMDNPSNKRISALSTTV